MTNASQFFLQQFNGILMSINTAMPCKVISFNEAECTAKIQPLFKAKEYGKDPVTLPPIEDVPVLFHRYKVHNNKAIKVSTDKGEHAQYTGTGEHVHKELRFAEPVEMIPHLIAGDIVQVVFNQRAIENTMDGKPVYAGTASVFNLNDAVVVGVFRT